jgi:hypothetical protein
MNHKEAQTSKALETGVGVALVADQGVSMRLRYVGSPQSAPDYADAVLVSATSLTLTVNGAADTTLENSGVLLFATYTTLGSLVDAINLSANWEAEIVAGLRTDAVNGSELLARSTSTFRPYTSVELKWDSSDNGVLGIDYALEVSPAFTRSTLKAQTRVAFERLLALVNTSGGEAVQVYVYEVNKDRAAVVRTLAQFTATDNTALDTGEVDFPIHAEWGNDILVRFRGTGWVDSGAYLRVQGRRQ